MLQGCSNYLGNTLPKAGALLFLWFGLKGTALECLPALQLGALRKVSLFSSIFPRAIHSDAAMLMLTTARAIQRVMG